MLYSSLFSICSVLSGLSVLFFFSFSQLRTYLLQATPCLRSGYAIKFSFRIISANIRAKFLLRGTRCLHPEQIARSQLSALICLSPHLSAPEDVFHVCHIIELKHFSSLRQARFFHQMLNRKTDTTLITDHQKLLSLPLEPSPIKMYVRELGHLLHLVCSVHT